MDNSPPADRPSEGLMPVTEAMVDAACNWLYAPGWENYSDRPSVDKRRDQVRGTIRMALTVAALPRAPAQRPERGEAISEAMVEAGYLAATRGRVPGHAITRQVIADALAAGFARAHPQPQVEAERYRAALAFIAQQPCRCEAEGSSDDFPCTETTACVTEFCHPCYALTALEEGRDTESSQAQIHDRFDPVEMAYRNECLARERDMWKAQCEKWANSTPGKLTILAAVPQAEAGQLAIYRENGDTFLVRAVDQSDAEYSRYAMRVLRVIAEDPRHLVRYHPGDELTVLMSKTVPCASAYGCDWTIDLIEDAAAAAARKATPG